MGTMATPENTTGWKGFFLSIFNRKSSKSDLEDETSYLLASSANKKRLLAAMRQFDAQASDDQDQNNA